MPIEHTYHVAGKEITRVLNRTSAIKEHCKDCCAGSWNEVIACHLETCPLHPFRLGNDPGIKKRVLTDEQKTVACERLRKAREAQH